MPQNSEDDEIEIFTRKIKALKNVAGDLNEIIDSQNKRIKGVAPRFNNILGKVDVMIHRIGNVDSRRFRGWKYYLLATFIVIILIFILFIIF